MSELSPHSKVTPRESEVMSLIAEGRKRDEIAKSLGISQSAVEGRINFCRARNNCRTVSQLLFLLGRETGAAGRHKPRISPEQVRRAATDRA